MLGELSEELPQLVSFYLSLKKNKFVTDKTFKMLSVFLFKHPALSYLGIDGQETGVTKEGIECLISQCGNLKKLHTLYANFR